MLQKKQILNSTKNQLPFFSVLGIKENVVIILSRVCL